jgi:hypothetical protein
MKKCINLKPNEAAALARGEIITIWRVVKPSPPIDAPLPTKLNGMLWTFGIFDKAWREPFPINVPLLGKETWRPVGPWECRNNGKEAQYSSDGLYVKVDSAPKSFRIKTTDSPTKWRASSNMPPWAVRTLVTLSDVRVRKPCDVTEEEAVNMGYKFRFTKSCLLSPQIAFCEDWSLAYGDTETAWNSYWWIYTATPTRKQQS